jgi:hypothetical protein
MPVSDIYKFIKVFEALDKETQKELNDNSAMDEFDKIPKINNLSSLYKNGVVIG